MNKKKGREHWLSTFHVNTVLGSEFRMTYLIVTILIPIFSYLRILRFQEGRWIPLLSSHSLMES